MALLGHPAACRGHLVDGGAGDEAQDRVRVGLGVLPPLDLAPALFDDALAAPVALPQADEVALGLRTGRTGPEPGRQLLGRDLLDLRLRRPTAVQVDDRLVGADDRLGPQRPATAPARTRIDEPAIRGDVSPPDVAPGRGPALVLLRPPLAHPRPPSAVTRPYPVRVPRPYHPSPKCAVESTVPSRGGCQT